MKLKISSNIRLKLTDVHKVREEEIIQCFANREEGKGYLNDTREEHSTNPPTLWFVAETDFGRKLKVMFIQEDDGEIRIKSAYEATANIIRIYEKFA